MITKTQKLETLKDYKNRGLKWERMQKCKTKNDPFDQELMLTRWKMALITMTQKEQEREKERERGREFLSCKEKLLNKAKMLKREGEVGGERTDVEVGLNRQTVSSFP